MPRGSVANVEATASAAGPTPASLSPMALWAVLAVAALALVLWRWSARRRGERRGSGDTPHEREQRMNLEIRRSRHVEHLQQEYARKAEEFKALQEAKAAELRLASKAAVAPGPSAPPAAPRPPPTPKPNAGDGWSPLMGSGPVGGFKTQRATRRGG